DQLMHQPNAPERGAHATTCQIKPDISAPHHWLPQVRGKVESVQPRNDPPLAGLHPFCNNLMHSNPSVCCRGVLAATTTNTPENAGGFELFFRLPSRKGFWLRLIKV